MINGEYVATEAHINSLNPSNFSETVGQVGQISVEQADRAMQSAKTAFLGWKRTPPTKRAAILHTAADLMTQRRDELAAWMVFETGKPLNEANGEVSEAIDFCRYYADEMARLDVGVAYDFPGETNRYHYQRWALLSSSRPGIFR